MAWILAWFVAVVAVAAPRLVVQEGPIGTVTDLDFSPDGQHLVVGDDEGRIVLYGRDGRTLRTLGATWMAAPIAAVAVDAQGRVAMAGADGAIATWRPATERFEPLRAAGRAAVFGLEIGAFGVTAVGPDGVERHDGRQWTTLVEGPLLTGDISGNRAIVTDGRTVQGLEGGRPVWKREFPSVDQLALGDDTVLVVVGSEVAVWRTRDGRSQRTPSGAWSSAQTVFGERFTAWAEVRPGAVRSPSRDPGRSSLAAFSPSEPLMVVANRSQRRLELWRPSSRGEWQTDTDVSSSAPVRAVGRRGDQLVVAMADGRLGVWDLSDGTLVHQRLPVNDNWNLNAPWATSTGPRASPGVALSADGATWVRLEGPTLVASRVAGRESQEIARYTVTPGDASIEGVTVSRDGSCVGLMVEGRALKWQPAPGARPALGRCLDAHDGVVTDGTLTFRPDGPLVAIERGGRRLGRFGSLRRGSFDEQWVTVDTTGRFDLAQPREPNLLRFVEGSAIRPADTYLTHRFAPGLLGRLVRGRPLPEPRSIGGLNPVLPVVRITDVRVDDQVRQRGPRAGQKAPGLLSIDVTVTGAAEADRRTAASDLRVFIDGQLVATAPEGGGRIAGTERGGARRFTFSDIPIPNRSSNENRNALAYAFNDDGLKSRTSRKSYVHTSPLPPDLPGSRAWVLTAGVDTYQRRRSLEWAVRDACTVREAMTIALSSGFDGTTGVALVSGPEGCAEAPADDANAGTLCVALARLAGADPDAQCRGVLDGRSAERVLERVPALRQFTQSDPDDVVFVALAGHGDTDTEGRFHFYTSDTRAPDSVTSEDLARWLAGVAAREIVLVLDTCASAASVDEGGFRAGPLGARGLGQLAYDKRMRILAGSQADAVAFERDDLRHGMLSFALVQRGLEAGRADHDPADGRIELGEWLRFATAEVPRLFERLRKGETIDGWRTGRLQPGVTPPPQRPEVFDFSGDRPPLYLERPLPKPIEIPL